MHYGPLASVPHPSNIAVFTHTPGIVPILVVNERSHSTARHVVEAGIEEVAEDTPAE